MNENLAALESYYCSELLLLHQVGRVSSGLPAVLIGSLAKEIGLGLGWLEG